MKHYYILLILILMSSCATHKKIQKELIKEQIKIDSVFDNETTSKDIEIEWLLAPDTTGRIPEATQGDTSYMPTQFLPFVIPGKKGANFGKVKIHISESRTGSRGEVKANIKTKTKTKTREPQEVLKKKSPIGLYIFIFITILIIYVKTSRADENFIKNVWNKS